MDFRVGQKYKAIFLILNLDNLSIWRSFSLVPIRVIFNKPHQNLRFWKKKQFIIFRDFVHWSGSKSAWHGVGLKIPNGLTHGSLVLAAHGNEPLMGLLAKASVLICVVSTADSLGLPTAWSWWREATSQEAKENGADLLGSPSLCSQFFLFFGYAAGHERAALVAQLVKNLPAMQDWSEVTQSCPMLCDHMDCSPPDSSIHGILQARVLD